MCDFHQAPDPSVFLKTKLCSLPIALFLKTHRKPNPRPGARVLCSMAQIHRNLRLLACTHDALCASVQSTKSTGAGHSSMLEVGTGTQVCPTPGNPGCHATLFPPSPATCEPLIGGVGNCANMFSARDLQALSISLLRLLYSDDFSGSTQTFCVPNLQHHH